MATPTTPASTSAAPATQGTIVFVQGEAYLRDRQGKLQAIKPGDAVAEGQEIVTTAGALVNVQLPSGAKLSVGPDRQVLLNDELFATAAPEPTENVVSSLGADADKVIQALNTGGDPFAGLEDPAAGLTGGGNSDQTHNFVRLVRILEDVTPLAFNYTSSSDGIDFLPVSSVPAQPTTTATNQPPVATDDPAFTTREDEATTVTVLTNDSDPDGDPISVTRASAPNGTVTLNPDGTLRYVPNPDFNGTDTITYTISDGKGGTATATVTVNVTPVNDPPVARPDTATTNEDTPVTIPVLGNDSDVDGDPLTVTGATVNPAQGSVVINPDGTLSFTPAPNFNGPAQITYTIEDGRGGTTTAVVTVEVAPVNDAPVARNDVDGLVKTDTVPATGNLITNPAGLDTDLEGDTLTVSAIGSAPVTGATVISGLFGTLTIQPNGEYSYAQDVANPAIVALAPGNTLQDRFTYTVSDGKGGTATATLTLNIAGANTPPVAQPDSVSTDEDTPVTFPVLGNDSDPEGDPLTVTGATVNPAQGSVVINPDGTLSFTPAPNFNGPAQITYTIEDGRGGTTTAVVTVEVAPVNDAPVARNDVDGLVKTDTVPATGNLITNPAGLDTDLEGDTLTVSAIGSAPVTGATVISGLFGTLTIQPNGEYSYAQDVANPAIVALAPGDTLQDRFTYTVSDGKGGTATATLTLNIAGANTPPIAQPDSVSTDEDTPVTFPVLGNDSDPEGDPLTVTGATVNPAQGSVVINPDGTLSFTPAPNFNGPAQITYTIEDGRGGTTTAVVTVEVAPVNDAPVARNDVDGLVKTDTVPATGNLITNPAGLDTDLEGDTLTVSAIGSAPVTGATVISGLFGTLTIQPNGEYSYAQDVANPAIVALAPGDTLQDRFTYTVSDGKGGTATATLTLNIAGANTPPVAQPDSVSTDEDTPVTFPVLGNDSDPEGDPLTVTGATVNPAQGSVVINPDGTLSFTPAPNFNGPAQITYTIEDGRGGTTTAVVTVEVAPVNDAPVARNDVDGLVKTDTVPATGNLITNPAGLDTDLEGDTLTVSAIGSAPVTGATVISGLFGTLTIQPNGEYSYAQDVANPAIVALAPGDTLQDRFTYTVSDGKGGTATATLTLNIAGANTPPVAQPDSVSTDEDTPVTFPVLGNDSDPEGDPLTVTGATVNPAQGSVVINPDGTLSFTPAPNFNGPAQITYTIEDGRGGTTTAVVTVEVAPVNDAPVARNDSGRVEEDATLVVELDNGLIASALDPAGKDTDIEGDPLTVTALRTGTETGSGTTGTVGSPLPGAYGSLTINPQGSYTYVADRATALAAGKTATDTFTYTISDGKGGTDTAELVITITGTNDTPVQVGTLPGVSGTDARSVTIPTAAGFADPDSGDTLTFTATGLPPGLSIDPASGLITGTLASDASVGGPYPITVTVTDGSGAQASQTFNLSVGNPAPIASPDTLALTENDTRGGNVLTGSGLGGDKADTDPDGDTLIVTRVGTGSTPDTDVTATGTVITGLHGNLTLKADGSYTYTATDDRLAAGATATDTFTYTISDAQGGTSTTTLTVTVTGTNDGAVITGPDFGTVTEDATLSAGGQLLATDVDSPARFTAATAPGAYGNFSIDAAGNWTYTLNNTDPAVQALGTNDVRIEQFTVSTADGSTHIVTVNVKGANEAPTAVDASATGAEDAASIPVTLGGGDVDGTVVGFSLANLPTNGTLYLDAAMTKPVIPGNPLPATSGAASLYFKPNANWNGNTSFQFSAIDGEGASSPLATVTIEVTAVNDNPIAADNRGAVFEDATLNAIPSNGLIASALDPAGKDTDIEGDPLTVTALRTGTEAGSGTTGTVGSPLSGAYGSLTVNPQGSYTYVADRATALAAGKTATDTFTYTISDGKGGTDTAELVITITGTNDTPVQVGTLPGVSGTDARSVTIPTAAGFADPDSGDTLTFTATGLPPGLSIDPASGLITGTLASDASVGGPYPITVTVTDGSGAQTSQTFNLSVGNPAPIASPDTLALTENDTQGGNVLTGSGLGGDKADTDPDGDTLIVTRVGTGSTPDTDVTATGTVITGLHGSLTLKADGSYTYTATDDRLAAGATATDTFTYTISDAQGGTSTTTLTVTVTGTNDVPAVLATSANVSEEGLAGGEADTLGTIDTTDAVSHSGIINLSDADGDALSVTLSAPADSISSAGVPIVWSGSGTHTLIGSAGGVEIIRATVGDDGRYTVTLSGAIDHPTTGEDARSLGLGVNVSDGTTTVQSTLTITVEDDAPQVAEIKQTIEVAPIDTNLLLILDTSGSMNTGDGVAGTSRLATAISALNQLLDSYDNFGEVRVRLVTFSDSANSRGSGWMAVSEAKALLAALTPSGGTNYDAALATAQSAFGTAGKLASGQNIAYFLSDGQPSFTQWAIDTNEESAWKSFLSTNDITSYALGMGSRTAQGDLNPIAYNGTTNTDLDGQVITDFNKLAGALQTTIPPTASGEILSGSLHGTGFGGDGGHVSSITVDGVTYTPDTSLGTLTASGGTSTATYDATTNSIRVLTATSGTLALDFDTGSYTYTPPPSVSTSVINDGFTYVLTDNDGDSASSRVLFTASRMNENTITLSSPQQVSGTSGNDSITGSSGNDSVSGGAGNDVIKGGDGDNLIAGGAGHDTLTGGAGADTFKWSLGEAGTTAAPAVNAITDFNTASASTGVDVLDLRDLLQGESHTGTLAGNLGSYLHFEKIGADTVVNVSSNGGFSGGNYSATDQKLILQGVDLTTLGTDTQIIQNLLANGKLNTD